jgi:hypothetical protein
VHGALVGVAVISAPAASGLEARNLFARAQRIGRPGGHGEHRREYCPCGPATPGSSPRSATRRAPGRRCEQIFIDKASGKLTRWSELDKALRAANRSADQLVITKLDRLGRSLEHVFELSRSLGVRRQVCRVDSGCESAASRVIRRSTGLGLPLRNAAPSDK